MLALRNILAPSPGESTEALPDEGAQRRICTAIVVSTYAFLLGEPLVTYAMLGAEEGSAGIPLRIHALAYGPPLILAVFFSFLLTRKPPPFAGGRTLDLLAHAMTAYWVFAGALGIARGNDMGRWLSSCFNFSVPPLAYFAIRRLSDGRQLDRLVRHIALASLVSLPLSTAVSYYALIDRSYVGAGGILFVVPLTAGTELLTRGFAPLGVAVIIGALVNNAIAMKRAVWAVLVAFPFVYLAVSGATLRRLATLLVTLTAVLGAGWAVVGLLPERAGFEAMSSRAQTLETETQGFTAGQAREDEVRSIWREVVTNGGPDGVLFGHGLGATYTYVCESTTGEAVPKYNNAHFTPGGWLLRGGFFGATLNLAFYAAAIALVIRAAGKRRRASWQPVYATYFILAVVISSTSFSLTPSPITHVVMMATILRSADGSSRRTASTG